MGNSAWLIQGNNADEMWPHRVCPQREFCKRRRAAAPLNSADRNERPANKCGERVNILLDLRINCWPSFWLVRIIRDIRYNGHCHVRLMGRRDEMSPPIMSRGYVWAHL